MREDWKRERQEQEFNKIARAMMGCRIRPEQADELRALLVIATDPSYDVQLQLPLQSE